MYVYKTSVYNNLYYNCGEIFFFTYFTYAKGSVFKNTEGDSINRFVVVLII